MYKNIKLNFNYDGVLDFVDTFNCKERVTRERVLELFNKPAYSEFVKLFGNNFVSNKNEDWTDIFYEAYELAISNREFEEDDVVKKNIIGSVIWGINNVTILEGYCHRVTEFLNKKEFLRKALYYLPELNNENIEVNINYYIFMYNASVEENKVLVDVAFHNALGDDRFSDLMAHEMHHYLQNYLHIKEGNVKPEYKDVIKPLGKLVSEGIADMCNFQRLIHIYEGYGWMEKGSLNNTLSNSEKYIKDLGYLLNDRIVNKNTNVNINNFIYKNNIIHPIGYTIASKIDNVLGINELRQCVDMPIRFLEKYNDVYKIENGQAIFEETLIKKLYEMYL